MKRTSIAAPLLFSAILAAQPKEMKNSMGMEMVLIPAGEFQMGCSPSDRNCSGDEKPYHLIKITKPFYMGKHEVTQEQWQTLMGGNPSYFNESRVGADWKKHPVEQVSWNAAQEFLQRLGEKEKRKYRLPSEAEWEYAARAGTTDASQGGAVDRVGWSWLNSGGNTHPVGQLKPNAWGLYDMLGNVWEWVQDQYADDYYMESPAVDPTGAGPDTRRGKLSRIRHPRRRSEDKVCRGSSWYWKAERMRVSERQSYGAGYGDYAGGFRVVMEAQ